MVKFLVSQNFLFLLDRERVSASASFVIKSDYNPCMRDFCVIS